MYSRTSEISLVGPPEYSLPQYRISTNGTAVTPDGGDISPICAATYSATMNDKVRQMAAQANQIIGQSLCQQTGDLVIDSAVSTLVFDWDEVCVLQVSI